MNEEILAQQNKVIISLLARNTIGFDYIAKIVTGWKKKGKPEDYLKVYNALDGTKSIADLAKMVGVSSQGLGQVLLKWEEEGIVYRNSTAVNFQYIGLLKLPEKLSKQANASNKKTRKGVVKRKNRDEGNNVIDGSRSFF